MVAAIAADAGIDEQGQELAAFDQLGIRARLVILDVEQEPSLAEDVAEELCDAGG